MNSKRRVGAFVLMAVLGCWLVSACTSSAPRPVSELPGCVPPQGHALQAALQQARDDLGRGCVSHFDRYVERLLVIAEGDPSAQNKQAFSDFFLWASNEGLLGKRQAQHLYNRYFNVKFVSLAGDFNNCSATCPRRNEVLYDMKRELGDKELGLLRISEDRDGYYRADRLFKETELVLEATCSACSVSR